jgi:hypothetical protein
MMKTRGYLVIALALLLGACNYAGGGRGDGRPAAPQAWIDQPLEGSQFLLGDTIPIQWHASGDDGLRVVEVRANGELLDTADTLDGDFDAYALLVRGELDWAPARAGEYLIQVEPTGPDDVVGIAAENRVHVYADGGTIAGMVATDFNLDGDAQDEGEGPLEGATVIVVYCGDKLSMRTDERGRFEFTNVPIGICTIVAEKPGWFFAGTHPAELDRPIHVQSDPELPTSLTFYLSQEATPTPEPTAAPTPLPFIPTVPPVIVATMIPTALPPDTQAPPAPTIISPQGGVLLGCLDSIVLRWNAVSDASGIDIYQVRLNISYDNGATWSGVGTWELDSLTSVGVEDQTDCGNLYRWRVRARDNAGNLGPYSPFATFGIALP